MNHVERIHFRRHPSWTSGILTISTISSSSFATLAFLRFAFSFTALQSTHSIPRSKGFIFELTDLYEKKNFPKVIYCIHALRYAFYSYRILGSPSNVL